ncbi:MAG: hypothetical protein AAF458_02020 [Pseudomonadota bacterium]
MNETAHSSGMTVVNIAALALIAGVFEQVGHEAVHAVAALAVGAEVTHFNFWAVAHGWPGEPGGQLAEGIIAGSAAPAEILLACACIAAFTRVAADSTWRLLVLYVGALAWFSGFGYLLVDPFLASPDATGDWAKVTMLLGGGWDVRLSIAAIGAAGTVGGYFVFGQLALQIVVPRMERRKNGATVLVLPYILVGVVFSLLTYWHPVGTAGVVAVMMKLWLGHSGLFWAFFIKFVCDTVEAPAGRRTSIPARLQIGWVVTALIIISGSVSWLVVSYGNLS